MVEKACYLCDLHTHTLHSDGNDTNRELIDKAAELGLRVLAITDHDVRPIPVTHEDGHTVSAAVYGLTKGLRVIDGIEFSCDTHVDDVHIVGLGCDFTDPLFDAVEEESQRSKIEGYRRLVEILAADGMNLTWEELLENKGAPRQEHNIQRKHIFEAIAQKGYTRDWSEAKILVRNTPKYSVRREKIDPLRAIRIIKDTGGLAILAHPYLIDDQVELKGRRVSRFDYIEPLIAAGLDGMEAAYPYDKTSYKGNQTPREIESEVRQRYESRLNLISGGSDYHNDGKKGAKNPRMIGEKGVTEEYFNSVILPLLECARRK